MAYRKINVNGKAYDYSVGSTHVKIRGFKNGSKVERKENVGHRFYIAEYCECCGTAMHELYSNYEYSSAIAVTPANVAAYILANA